MFLSMYNRTHVRTFFFGTLVPLLSKLNLLEMTFFTLRVLCGFFLFGVDEMIQSSGLGIVRNNKNKSCEKNYLPEHL